MDVRASANPVLASARRWLARVNARHPWSHNEHFHGWILRNLPARRRAAVDVGCRTGVLAGKLAAHFARVTGIDADASMAAAASARLAHDRGVTIRRCGFEHFASAAGDGEADLITMVAVLHHLDLDDTLARIPGLLAPGGRLLVVGLARVNALPDLAADLISAAANPVMGLIKHPRPARPADGPAAGQPVMPVKDAATTLAEITAAARAHLPGATLRRRLFFRYTLRWDKPPVTAPPPALATLEPGNHHPGGWMALLGNVVVRRPGEPEVYAETADLHERFSPGNPGWGHPPLEDEVRRTDEGWGLVKDPGSLFGPAIVRWYPAVQWLDGDGFADLLRSTSLYRRLDSDVRDPLLDAIAERIRTQMGNRASRQYLSVLRAGRRAQAAYGQHSQVGKILEIHQEMPGRIHVVLIRQQAGF